MAEVELQILPTWWDFNTTPFKDMKPGRYLIGDSTTFNALGLPGVLAYGLLEIVKWTPDRGAAYWMPRDGTVRIWSRSLGSQGWGVWAD